MSENDDRVLPPPLTPSLSDEEIADIEQMYVLYGDSVPTCRDNVFALIASLRSERSLRGQEDTATGSSFGVRGNVTTNHAEGYFAQLKNSLTGTFHNVSVQHLPRYLAEFDYRWSTREMNDSARMEDIVGRVGGRRLSYEPLRNND